MEKDLEDALSFNLMWGKFCLNSQLQDLGGFKGRCYYIEIPKELCAYIAGNAFHLELSRNIEM